MELKKLSEHKEVIVKLADILFSDQLTLDLGDATCKDFTIGKKEPALCKKLTDTLNDLQGGV